MPMEFFEKLNISLLRKNFTDGTEHPILTYGLDEKRINRWSDRHVEIVVVKSHSDTSKMTPH